jgi:hypothetical protein
MVAWQFYLREPVLSLWSHLRYGNAVAFQGHILRLPLMWRVDHSNKKAGLSLTRAVIQHPPSLGEMYSDTLTVYSPDPTQAGRLDDASAARWQAAQIASLNSRSPRSHATAETIHASSITFYCVENATVERLPDNIFCKPAGIDWLVFAGLNPAFSQEAQGRLDEEKDILRSLN